MRDPRRVALIVALVGAACGVIFLAYSATTRPYGAVEAEMVFQASRIQKGYPLYTDPFVGAWEAGPPPSRYYVLYTPAYPSFLALLATLSPPTLFGMCTVGRVFNSLLMLLTLAAMVRGAKAENRVVVATGACLALGLGLLVRETGLACADMPAVALAAFGLARMNRKGALDPLATALLATAPLVKPSVLGIAFGALVAHAIVRRTRGPRALLVPLLGGVAVAVVLLPIFHVWSHGAWLEHIVRATGQTISGERWVQEFGSRAMFLGAPHAIVLIVAVRRKAPLVATLPLATSIAWSTFSMAKHGSGTHYWLEPTMAALVALGTLPASPVTRASTILGWAGVALGVGVAASSLPSFAGAPSEYRGVQKLIADLKASCPLDRGEVVIASDVRIELAIDGRILIPAWQNAYLVRSGKFPLDGWREDLARKEVRWFIHGREILDPPPERIEGVTEVSVYRKELKAAVDESFVLDHEIDGVLVYRRR